MVMRDACVFCSISGSGESAQAGQAGHSSEEGEGL